MRLIYALIYIIGAGILSHYIGEALPRSWFNPCRPPFSPLPFERSGKLYRALRVHNWKDKVPDMSRVLPKMVPKNVSMRGGSAEVRRVLVETCVAETVHFVLMLLSFILYLIVRDLLGAVIAILYGLSHIPFIIIQRYNRPTLLILAQRLEEREERLKHAHTDPVSEYR